MPFLACRIYATRPAFGSHVCYDLLKVIAARIVPKSHDEGMASVKKGNLIIR